MASFATVVAGGRLFLSRLARAATAGSTAPAAAVVVAAAVVAAAAAPPRHLVSTGCEDLLCTTVLHLPRGEEFLVCAQLHNKRVDGSRRLWEHRPVLLKSVVLLRKHIQYFTDEKHLW